MRALRMYFFLCTFAENFPFIIEVTFVICRAPAAVMRREFLFLQSIDEHAAGGKDVFTTGTADGGGDAMLGQIIPEPFHRCLI